MIGSVRREGVVLVGRKDGVYFFISSVFRHDASLYGCTGTEVCSVSEGEIEDALSADGLEERFYDYWHERSGEDIKDYCEVCVNSPREEGCEICGYQSLSDFCADIGRYEGYDAVFDYPGHEYEEALHGLLVSGDDPDCVETVHCIGCGRIFDRNDDLDGYDEVYNRKALEACIAYEGGLIDYGHAVRAIYNK